MNDIRHFESYASAVAAARLARASGDTEAAAGIYKRIVEQFPLKKDAVAFASDGLRACGMRTDAVLVLERALEHMPVSALLLSRAADAALEIRDYERAAGYLRRYVDYDPRQSDAWLQLAHLYQLAEDWANAEAAFARVLSAEPMNLTACLGRGDALFQLSRPGDAIEAYRQAVLTQPDNPAALFKFGSALMVHGDRTEAHRCLQRSLEIDPTNARALVNLGLIYFRAGRLGEAVALADRAIASDDALQIAHVLRGTVLAEQGDLEGARAELREGTRATENVEALFLLSSVEAACDDIIASERALQRILVVAPENKEARHYLAALHGEPVTLPPPGFGREAFDRVSLQFDDREMNVAGYGAPEALALLLERIQPDRRAIASLLDVGCGTGLAATALKDAFSVDAATGLDISPGMLEIARSKAIYHRLIEGDAVEGLRDLDEPFDVVVAMDLFPYLGSLERFMAIAKTLLIPGGILGYSIELSEGVPFKLAPFGRFVHSEAYVADLARKAGLEPVAAQQLTLRRTFGRDVRGLVGLLRRPI